MNYAPLRFHVHGSKLAIARLEPNAEIPAWPRGDFVSISHTRDELSIVCSQSAVPRDVRAERDRIGLAIVGVIPMTTVGLLASLCTALAAANVPVFVISTYDTDWILVSAERFASARKALEGLGHTVSGTLPES
jgi:hypothetical protein